MADSFPRRWFLIRLRLAGVPEHRIFCKLLELQYLLLALQKVSVLVIAVGRAMLGIWPTQPSFWIFIEPTHFNNLVSTGYTVPILLQQDLG